MTAHGPLRRRASSTTATAAEACLTCPPQWSRGRRAHALMSSAFALTPLSASQHTSFREANGQDGGHTECPGPLWTNEGQVPLPPHDDHTGGLSGKVWEALRRARLRGRRASVGANREAKRHVPELRGRAGWPRSAASRSSPRLRAAPAPPPAAPRVPLCRRSQRPPARAVDDTAAGSAAARRTQVHSKRRALRWRQWWWWW